ncbi:MULTISPECIES: hypothetical protein [unclassified Streptomyces]|uniref:hypothetical protein n=1 Tax=unclassified Streptomyces TaxID=2593676 RepID=UPI001F03ABE0|nr:MULTISPECIES: hypothetical protein [unclassified Streptomyces]MCH0566020.1 hypothetical protein [Streptomyces sp. MUM 2J]MCH0571289.1 hypothetical protein [Streptomyces sp. MUM 136J]
MTKSVPVRCPACRREHLYAAPAYPCACGAPVAPPLDAETAPTAVTHRVWDEQWIAVNCPACGRRGQWPQPELDCPCGTVLRLPVARGDAEPEAETVTAAGAQGWADAGPAAPARRPEARPDAAPRAEAEAAPDRIPRPAGAAAGAPGAPARGSGAFRPVAIRTARDAVLVAALYLRWLGYPDVRRADQRPPNGIGLAARGMLAQVDPTACRASLRDVECLWLTAMTESAGCVYFSLTGYTPDARDRADSLGVPLFVLGPAGTPLPVNGPARELAGTDPH